MSAYALAEAVEPIVTDLEFVSAETLSQGIAAAPLDHFVIWDGSAYEGRPGSRTTRALGLVTEPWKPVSLRELIMRAARLQGDWGLSPDTVRNAVRQHQRARGAGYLWVRRVPAGDYVLVSDVPFAASRSRPTPAGSIILSRDGARFGV